MRKLLACLSFSVVLATYAQQCTITPYAMSVPSAWTQCDMFPDGGLVLVESNNTTDLFDDVLLKRIAPSGATLWTKVLSNTNPLVGLQQPARIVALSDGGAAIFGQGQVWCQQPR